MNERDRIAAVYDRYAQDGAATARWSAANPGNSLIHAEREAATRGLITAGHLRALPQMRILEVGCGWGSNLEFLVGAGASPSLTTGIDLLPVRVQAAKRRLPGCRIEQADAQALDFPDGSFDLVLLYTVLSSVNDPVISARIVAEVRRVLKTDGTGGVLWYDMRVQNPWNRNVHGISQRELRRLFPGSDLTLLRSLTPLPPLVRRLGPLTRPGFAILRRIPILRSHIFGLIRFPPRTA